MANGVYVGGGMDEGCGSDIPCPELFGSLLSASGAEVSSVGLSAVGGVVVVLVEGCVELESRLAPS